MPHTGKVHRACPQSKGAGIPARTGTSARRAIDWTSTSRWIPFRRRRSQRSQPAAPARTARPSGQSAPACAESRRRAAQRPQAGDRTGSGTRREKQVSGSSSSASKLRVPAAKLFHKLLFARVGDSERIAADHDLVALNRSDMPGIQQIAVVAAKKAAGAQLVLCGG